jgi:uncharacterized membrane protein YdbT with pleckstrin-like domain
MEQEATNPAEEVIWSGSSSQVRNLHIYLLCALFCWLIIPIFYAIWKWIELRSRHYELTTQRVRIRPGIFSKRTDELELYRVKDTTILEPFWQRIFGLGNIVITTNDASTPSLTLEALPKAARLANGCAPRSKSAGTGSGCGSRNWSDHFQRERESP